MSFPAGSVLLEDQLQKRVLAVDNSGLHERAIDQLSKKSGDSECSTE